MAVEFVAYRAGEKSDELILEKISDRIKHDPLSNVIILVPPQATYMTENHILRSLQLKGIMGIQVMGPEKLTQRILDSVHGRAKKVVDAAAKSMIVRLLMERHRNELAALGLLARSQNICADIAAVISEFKSLDITPDQLCELRSEDENTNRKLTDIAFLYRKFDEYLCERALTTEDRMNIAIDNVKNARFIADADVFVLHFDLLTTQMERFVAEIAHTAKNTIISFLDTHPGDADGELFDVVRDGRMKLKNRIGGEISLVRAATGKEGAAGALSHIERNLYAYPYAVYSGEAEAVRVVRAGNVAEEAAAAAEAICSLVCEEGYSFGDIAVVCGNLSDYADEIKNKFTEANIPYFLDDKRNAGQNFIAGFLLSALEAADGKLKKDRLLTHLGFAWGTHSTAVEILKNYAFENISNAYAFEKPFMNEEAELARTQCVLPVIAFCRNMKKAALAGEKIRLLREYMQSMGVWERAEERIGEWAARSLFASGEYYEQAAKRIMEILDSAERILQDVAITTASLADILKSGFESTKVSMIPQGVDEVMVGDIRVSMLMDVRALFVLGANEGKIPDYGEKSDVLLQRERDFIFGIIAHITAFPLMVRQKLTIYRMFSLPSERLTVSYSSLVEGAPAQPSVLVDRLCELLGIRVQDACLGKLLENAVFIAAGEIRSIADGYGQRGHEMTSALLRREDTRDRILGYEWMAARSNAAAKLQAGWAKQLFGGNIASPTRYETFFSCPFKHYVLYGIRPKILREHTMNSLDIGNYVHGVLDAFSKELKRRGKNWGRITDEEMQELLRESIACVKENDVKYGASAANQHVVNALEREIALAAVAIRHHFEASSIEMAETELPFALQLGGVTLRGKIDRLDLARVGDQLYMKIVDYKTGDKEWFLEDFVEGLSLQLVVYLLAGMEYAKQNGGEAKAAGADYFIVRMPVLEEFDAEKMIAEFKMKGIEAVDPFLARELYGYDGKEIVSLKLRVKKDGEFYAADSKDIFGPDEMEQLMAYAKSLIKHALSEIDGGRDEIAPVSNAKGQLPCIYCELKSVCLNDTRSESGKKNKPGRDEIFTRMRALLE